LEPGTTYYWQVRAKAPTGRRLREWQRDGVWSFTTLPGAFGKLAPTSGAAGQAGTPTLTWGPSSGAASYEYCLDQVNDDTCNGSWINTGLLRSLDYPGLGAGTTYYWQVRAIAGSGKRPADDGVWWSFATGAGAFRQGGAGDRGAGADVDARRSRGRRARGRRDTRSARTR